MKKMEVFFDYTCPYCFRGHKLLVELLADCPEIEVVWCPCEAHPRPEHYGIHCDLAIRAMFHARQQGVDLWAFHDRVYHMIHKQRVNVENADAIADNLQDMLDPEELRQVLKSDAYTKELAAANKHAYEQSGVWAVPSFRMDGDKLDAIENVGVTRDQLQRFMEA